jgi:UDP-2,4-diacetamido-2,4,6-trideoxy-beta-L-altropyranose hydrolase
MKILIRADASVEIGSGHLMRCLTLADQLRDEGAEVAFICRDLPGGMFDFLRSRDYRFAKLPVAEADKVSQQTDARETIEAARQLFPGGVDWLVVDHYRLDAMWEHLLRTHANKLMVIDDLANRPHDCDLLLDQNYYRDMERRYQGLVSERCVTLLGPKYVLLRPEFAAARQSLRARDGIVRRILIFFGGSDSTNQTSKALDAIKLIDNPDISVDVVVGAGNPHRYEIESLCHEMRSTQYHCQVSNMAELIAAADIAVGAGGATTWERCALGLPALTVVFADNQLQTTLDLEQIGVTEFLGWADKITASGLAQAIEHLIENQVRLKSLSERARDVMREWQGAGAITSTMKKISIN